MNIRTAAPNHGHSGDGPLNANTGEGRQYNSSQAGSYNTQINHYGSGESSGAVLEDQCRKARQALYHSDPSIDRANLVTAKGERVAGTCEWIKSNETFKSWLNGDIDRLWIRGSPGKGKTMISIFLTEELAKTTQVIFYFCSHNLSGHSSATAVLRGLVWQITEWNTHLARRLLEYVDPETSERNKDTLDSEETLWGIFVDILKVATLSEPVYCILDGLDECDDDSRRWLVKKFTSSLDSHPLRTSLRLAIVSRDMTGLGMSAQIELDPKNDDKVDRDIRLVVASRMQELSGLGLRGFNKDHAFVQSQLIKRAKGTFLWVGYAMLELLKCTTTIEVVQRMNELPPGLEPLYARMIGNIKKEDRTKIARILRWIVLAGRTLSLSEVGAINGLPSTTISQDIDDALLSCKLIVRIQDEGLAIIHQSARDWLLRVDTDDDAVLEEFRIKAQETHLEMAEACLDHTLSSGPLSRYGQAFCVYHLKFASTLADSMFARRPEMFGEPCEYRDALWRKLSSNWYLSRDVPPPLHLACEFGLTAWAHNLLAENWYTFNFRQMLTERDDRGRTALFIAVHFDIRSVARHLLDLCADIDVRDHSGRTPLLYLATNAAGLRGAGFELLLLLLDRGADVNAQDNQGRTPLFTLVANAAELRENGIDLLTLLLDRGADINSRDKQGLSPLDVAVRNNTEMYAARSYDTDLIKLLLQKGAEGDFRGGCGRTALLPVYDRLELAEVKGSTILYNGPDACGPRERANYFHNRPWDSDHFRIRMRDVELMIRMLINGGARVTQRFDDGSTALHRAAYAGNRCGVQLLLDQGHEIDCMTKWRTTPLHLAVDRNHFPVVLKLLEHGADVNALDYVEGTALHYLARQSENIVSSDRKLARLLLSNGADMNLPNIFGRTARWTAIKWKKRHLVAVFAEHECQTE